MPKSTIIAFAAALLLSAPAALAVAADGPEPAGSVIEARPGAAEVLDLQACVREALENNDALRAERLRRKELDGQMNQALSTGLPTIDATGTWLRSRDPSFALDESFGGGGDDGGLSTGNAALDSLFSGVSFLPEPEAIPAQSFWRASLNLSWTLNPTKVLGAVGAAGLGIRRQELVVTGKEFETAEQAITAYHGVVLAAEQADAAAAELANQAEFLEIMRLRHELGLATELDTLQAAVSVANLEPQVRLTRRGLRTAGSRLNAVMGRPPENPVSIVAEQAVERDPLDRDRVLELAALRPDLRQMDVMADLLRQNRRAQKADMRPYLTMNGSYGYVGRELKGLDDPGHDFWSASIALNVPLFDGLLTKGLVQETEASIRRTEVERGGLLRQVRVEVLDLVDNLEAARRNLDAAELNMDRADDLLETSKLRLREGLSDYLTVLESEASRAQARTNLIQARHDVLTLTASLKRAVGVSPLLPFTAVTGLVKEGDR